MLQLISTFRWRPIFNYCLPVIVIAGCGKTHFAEPQVNYSIAEKQTNPTHNHYSALFIISPADGDSNVDVNTEVKISCNSFLYVTQFRIDRFIVSDNNEAVVPGKYVYTDTTAIFIPCINLKKNFTYSIDISGVAVVNQESELPTANKRFEAKLKFTTGEIPQYHLSMASSHVTDFARDGCKMMQMGDYLYIYGGWKGSEFSSVSYNEIYRSRDDLSVWEKLPNAPWQGRHTFGLGKLNDELYVFGGDQHTEFFDVWKSTDGENFTVVSQDLDKRVKSRLIYGACVHRSKLFLMGGENQNLDSVFTDVWTSPNGAAWRRLASDQAFLGKNLAGSVASFNDKIWVVGGGVYGHPDSSLRWTNQVYSSIDGKTWNREPDAPWQPRQFADVCVWDNKLWMIGGHNGRNLSEIWYMNRDGSWVQYIPDNSFSPRHATAVAVYNDKLVFACGDLNNECWTIEKVVK